MQITINDKDYEVTWPVALRLLKKKGQLPTVGHYETYDFGDQPSLGAVRFLCQAYVALGCDDASLLEALGQEYTHLRLPVRPAALIYHLTGYATKGLMGNGKAREDMDLAPERQVVIDTSLSLAKYAKTCERSMARLINEAICTPWDDFFDIARGLVYRPHDEPEGCFMPSTLLFGRKKPEVGAPAFVSGPEVFLEHFHQASSDIFRHQADGEEDSPFPWSGVVLAGGMVSDLIRGVPSDQWWPNSDFDIFVISEDKKATTLQLLNYFAGPDTYCSVNNGFINIHILKRSRLRTIQLVVGPLTSADEVICNFDQSCIAVGFTLDADGRPKIYYHPLFVEAAARMKNCIMPANLGRPRRVAKAMAKGFDMVKEFNQPNWAKVETCIASAAKEFASGSIPAVLADTMIPKVIQCEGLPEHIKDATIKAQISKQDNTTIVCSEPEEIIAKANIGVKFSNESYHSNLYNVINVNLLKFDEARGSITSNRRLQKITTGPVELHNVTRLENGTQALEFIVPEDFKTFLERLDDQVVHRRACSSKIRVDKGRWTWAIYVPQWQQDKAQADGYSLVSNGADPDAIVDLSTLRPHVKYNVLFHYRGDREKNPHAHLNKVIVV